MKKLLLLGIFLPSLCFGQLKILENHSSTMDLNGSALDVSGNPSSIEFVKELVVVNEGNTTLDIKVIRTEVDVLSGTKNSTCWGICPANEYAGVEPVLISLFSQTIDAADTNFTFAAHYALEGLDGCSLFKYDFVNADNTEQVYATINLRFLHSSTLCTVGIEENQNINLSVFPNPADNQLSFSAENLNGNLEYEIINMLGQTEISNPFSMNSSGKVDVNIEQLKNGIYFLAIKSNGKTLKTEKIIVK